MSGLTGSSSSGGDLGPDIKCLEHSTLKVPYEVLNKKFRLAQKVLDRECSHVLHATAELEKFLTMAHPVVPVPLESESGPTIVVPTPGDGGGGSSNSDGDSPGDPENMAVGTGEGDTVVQGVPDPKDESSPTPEESTSESEGAGSEKKANATGPNSKEVSKFLSVLIDRLQSLKRKAGESINEELEAAGLVRKRLIHLKSYNNQPQPTSSGGAGAAGGASSPAVVVAPPAATVAKILGSSHDTKAQWKKTRLNRMLVDHLLREGNYDTAGFLADSLGIRELTNVDVFTSAKEVEDSLRSHQTGRMVSWCYENKSKLRKLKSTLELEVRVQEFVELVRRGQRMEAVKHARKFLADSDDPEHMTAVKKCMGLLAFPVEEGTNKPAIHPYYELLSPSRWDQLIIHFRLDHARMYQLSRISVLGTVVQAGLAALKTPHCYRPVSQNPNCPVCSDPLNSLAKKLPYAHCAHSQLVCAISGEPLNENNPPMVLPSGFVYGTKSLKELAKANNGKVNCTRTGKWYNHSEAERVFVM